MSRIGTACIEAILILAGELHELLDGVIAVRALSQFKRIRDKRYRVGIVQVFKQALEVVDRLPGSRRFARLPERRRHKGGQGILSLETADHLLVVNESDLVE